MKKDLKYILILLGISYLFLMLGNGLLSLTTPDEVFYTQTAKEMLQRKSWMTPYLFDYPQFEKPILSYWLLKIGLIVFGASSFGARFFPALFGILGVIAIYFFGVLGFKDKKKAFLSGLVLTSGGLYVGLSRTVFTDLFFTIFIMLSLLSFWWGYTLKNRKAWGTILFFVFSALAVLTKGPLGFLMSFLTVLIFLILKKDIKFIFNRYWLFGFLLFLAISVPWYAFMIQRYGSSYIQEFFYNDHFRRIIEAEHSSNDTWYFYPLSMVMCMFPWSIFVLAALLFFPKYLKDKNNPFLIFLSSWIVVVLCTFQFAHSKLVSYIFPLFPALALLTANLIEERIIIHGRLRILLWLTAGGALIIPLGLGVGYFIYGDYISQYVANKNVLLGFILAFIVVIGMQVFFILRRRPSRNIYVTPWLMFVFLSIIPFVHQDIEPYLSQKMACEYLTKNYTIESPIISAKFFVRSVRYYTDKEVVVMDIPGKPFFSPHPVLFLDSDDKLEKFLKNKAITYCVVKKSSLEDIKRLEHKGFKHTLLKIIGNQYIVKIEPAV